MYLLAEDLLGPEKLAEIKGSYVPPDLLDMNLTYLEGPKLTPSELSEACEAMPFLAPKRLVVVRRLATRYEPRRGDGEAPGWDQTTTAAKPDLSAFLLYLSHVPEFTDLVFLESSALQSANPFVRAVRAAGGKVVDSGDRGGGTLEQWVRSRAQAKGGSLTTGAAADLVGAVGPSLRSLDSELEKLLLYGAGRTITEMDVAELVSGASQANIFALVDAVGLRNPRSAIELLHHLFDQEEPPLRILAMITRQFRLLLQVNQLRSGGHTQTDIAGQLNLKPFVVTRLLAQASRFSPRQLDVAYDRLLDADLSLKTSQMAPQLALDLLVIDLARELTAGGPRGSRSWFPSASAPGG